MARPELIDAIIQIESGGNPNAVSKKGARGMGQIMPATARNPGFGVTPLQDESEYEQRRFINDYMDALINKYDGDENLALAAYNAGPGAVDAHKGVPPFPETQNYVSKVGSLLNPVQSANAEEMPWDKAEVVSEEIPWDKLPGIEEAKQPMSWSEVGGKAVENFIPSLYNVGESTVSALAHPIETAKTLKDIAVGGISTAMPESWQSPEEFAKERSTFKTLADMYKQRYGSEEGFKQAIAEDPAGVMADLSTVLTGGAGLVKGAGKVATLGGAAKTGGLLGKSGEVLSKAGAVVDPLALPVKASIGTVNTLGSLLANTIGEVGTHTGGESIKTAFKAGEAGGQKAKDFLKNMRGAEEADIVVDELKGALSEMRKERGTMYREGMAGVTNDPTILDYAPIEDAMNKALGVKTRLGESASTSTAKVQSELKQLIDKFKDKDPTEWHTVEGLDFIKQAVGDIRDSTDFGSPSRVVANNVYNAIKNQITKQAPDYAKVMKDYQEASEILTEIQKSLSLGEKSSADTAIRKLQSIMRNNANTNYGARVKNVEKLAEYGAPNVMEKLAGQSLTAKAPRGLGKLAASGLAGAELFNLMQHGIDPMAIGGGLLLGASQSPRLMGESAYYAGKAKGLATAPYKSIADLVSKTGLTPRQAANFAYQANRNQQ